MPEVYARYWSIDGALGPQDNHRFSVCCLKRFPTELAQSHFRQRTNEDLCPGSHLIRQSPVKWSHLSTELLAIAITSSTAGLAKSNTSLRVEDPRAEVSESFLCAQSPDSDPEYSPNRGHGS